MEWCAITNRNGTEIPNSRGNLCGIASSVFNGQVTTQTIVAVEPTRNFTYFSYEYGSGRYSGEIVKTYKQGQIVDATVFVKKNTFIHFSKLFIFLLKYLKLI